jgi:phosphatidylglycerophosphatase C
VSVSVAVFDVDKTLTVRDCVVPFVTKVAGRAKVSSAVVRHFPEVVKLVVRKDRDGLKLLFVRELFAGVSVDRGESLGVEFAAMVAEKWIRPDVAARLRWHQMQGHVVVLVSASLSPYLIPFGDFIEADVVLCATLEESGGVYTGNLVGPNCRGEEKVRRIQQWCSESGVSLDSIDYAYGDSHGDAPMIAMARHGVWVHKDDIEEVPA